MSSVQMFDVVVVGNGALGASTALALLHREPKLKLALVGAASRPYCASSAAGAMHGCFGEVTSALLATSHGRKKLAMAHEATKRWPAWLEIVNGSRKENIAKTTPGTFVIENAKSGFIEGVNFNAMKQAAAELDAPCEDVDPASIPNLDPKTDARPLRAVYLPGEGSIDASLLLSNLELSLAAYETFTRIEGEASSLATEGGSIKSVTLRDGTVLEAKQVLLAAGATTQPVIDTLPDVARRIPRLFAGVGDSLIIEHDLPAFEHVIRTPNRAFACGLHVVPRGGRMAYVGATNVIQKVPAGPASSMTNLHFLMECVMDQVHQGLYASLVHKVQVGNRPVSADACPLIGETSVKGLFMLTGTYRDGLHLSSLLAPDMAERMLGRKPLVEHAFAPERKLIALRTREEAIDETVRHMMASGTEHNIFLPKTGWHKSVEDVFRFRAMGMYGGMSCEMVMPVDLVLMVEQDPERMVPYLDEYYRSFEAAWR